MGRRKKEAGVPLHRNSKSGAVGTATVERSSPPEVKPEVAPLPEPVAKEEPKPPALVEPYRAPEVPKPVKRVVLYVVGGKSLITKRGVRGPGDDVTADELGGGEDQLQKLKDAGFLGEGKK